MGRRSCRACVVLANGPGFPKAARRGPAHGVTRMCTISSRHRKCQLSLVLNPSIGLTAANLGTGHFERAQRRTGEHRRPGVGGGVSVRQSRSGLEAPHVSECRGRRPAPAKRYGRNQRRSSRPSPRRSRRKRTSPNCALGSLVISASLGSAGGRRCAFAPAPASPRAAAAVACPPTPCDSSAWGAHPGVPLDPVP